MRNQEKYRSNFASHALASNFGLTAKRYPLMTTKENSTQDPGFPRDGLPPFVRSWKQLYIVMIAALALLIVLFYFFMTHFQ
ncbi:hypothetical protein [Dyadobacter sp. CY323]|uniref:hypothetical protein n=1 Tax=Dyadobacter sp. CY323 TaxID=2907302 RepID=UPI001F1CC01C|nr:hypothetical protein [Dyadobacter sp. CY323]MCE6992599.1 hypothetical protein [Dyadobacter sp. CY323]